VRVCGQITRYSVMSFSVDPRSVMSRVAVPKPETCVERRESAANIEREPVFLLCARSFMLHLTTCRVDWKRQ
jgi:hypothetical protein